MLFDITSDAFSISVQQDVNRGSKGHMYTTMYTYRLYMWVYMYLYILFITGTLGKLFNYSNCVYVILLCLFVCFQLLNIGYICLNLHFRTYFLFHLIKP